MIRFLLSYFYTFKEQKLLLLLLLIFGLHYQELAKS